VYIQTYLVKLGVAYRMKKALILLLSMVVVISAMARGSTVVPPAATSSFEQTAVPTATSTATPTPTPSPSTSPTPTPEPYFDLENMTDEQLLLKCGVTNEEIKYIIGYAVDLGGVCVIKYSIKDLKCMALASYGNVGNRCTIYDFLTSFHESNKLFSTDQKIFSDVSLAASNKHIFDNPPFAGEPISEKYETATISVEKAFPISQLREYLESIGKSVPETKYSDDIEGLEMIGNIVSITGILRYFLTIAPHDEVMNHIKFNFPETDKIIMGAP